MTAPKVVASDFAVDLRASSVKTQDYLIPDDHSVGKVSINRGPGKWDDENFHVGCFVLATGQWTEPGPIWRVVAFFHASGGVVKMSSGEDAPATVMQFGLPQIKSRRLKASYVTIDGTPVVVESSLATI